MYPAYAMNHEQGFGLMTDSVFVQPIKGMMIIFPSFIPHYTMAHMDDKERIIFSSNATCMTDEHYYDRFSEDGKAILNRDDT